MSKPKHKLLSDSLVLKAVMTTSTDSIFVKDLNGRYVYANQHIMHENDILSPDDMVGKTNYDFFSKDFADVLAEQEKQIIKTGTPIIGSVIPYTWPNGQQEWRSTSKSPVYDDDDNIIGILGISRNVTEVEKAKQKVLLNEKKFRQMIENISEIIMILDESGSITYTSPNVYNVFSFHPKEIVGTKFMDFVFQEDKKIADAGLSGVIKNNSSTEISEFRIVDGKKEIKHIHLCSKNLLTDPPINGILINFRDITVQVKQDSKIRYLSYHDTLTDLYNRSFFEEEKQRLDTERQLPISIIMGDVNGLKQTNDTFGHVEGDKLLVTVAKILKESCRCEDIVARVGGDEFCILLPKTTLEVAETICARIRSACADCPYDEQNDTFRPSISLGCATKSKKGVTLESIYKSAEEYMYKEKRLIHHSTHDSIVDSFKKRMQEHQIRDQDDPDRMVELTINLGKALNLPDEQLLELDLLSRLHDIGKTCLDDNLLAKPGKLTEEEWKKVKRHPEFGFRIASASDELIRISNLILCHHERWDGKGYPKGIHQKEIPLLSRIVALIDAYEAMTQDRPYRKAMTKKAAIQEIVDNAGKQFDPEISRIFVEKVLGEPWPNQ